MADPELLDQRVAARGRQGAVERQARKRVKRCRAPRCWAPTVPGGDHCGLLVFGRRVKKFLPPNKGVRHIDAVLEALHDLEPELIEPSYSRAFQFVASNSKKRSFIVILTDLVDRES